MDGFRDQDESEIRTAPCTLRGDLAPRTTTMHVDAAAHELVKAAAEACGVTTAQFMREAALVRAVLTLRTDMEHLTPQEATQRLADFDAICVEVCRLGRL